MRLIWVLACLACPVTAIADTVTAVLEPAREIELRSTVNGRVAGLSVSDGDIVTAGDALATVDARVQEARVNLAQVVATADGAAQRAEQILKQAMARRDRIAQAKAKGAAQAWELLEADQVVAVAQADKAVAEDDTRRREAELALERATLSEFSVAAPFDATILEVFVEAGEIVDTGAVLMEIGTVDMLTATAFVPMEWIPALDRGATLRAATDVGRGVDAQVKTMDPRVDPASRTVRIVLSLDNADGALLPGTTLIVEAP